MNELPGHKLGNKNSETLSRTHRQESIRIVHLLFRWTTVGVRTTTTSLSARFCQCWQNEARWPSWWQHSSSAAEVPASDAVDQDPGPVLGPGQGHGPGNETQ